VISSTPKDFYNLQLNISWVQARRLGHIANIFSRPRSISLFLSVFSIYGANITQTHVVAICFFYFFCIYWPYLKPSGDKQLQKQKPWLWLLSLTLSLTWTWQPQPFAGGCSFGIACCAGAQTMYLLGRSINFFSLLLQLFFLLFFHRRLLMLAPSICHIYFVFIENNRQVSERLNG